MPAKRVVRFNQGGRPPHRGGGGRRGGGHGHGGQHGGHGGGNMQERKVETPRHTVPGYLARRFREFEDCPPGHRFLLYFQGASYDAVVRGADNREANRKRDELSRKLGECKWHDVYENHAADAWNPLKDAKKYALKSVALPFSGQTKKMSAAIRARQAALAAAGRRVFRFHARMTAPLATGLGNPHPVENGFSFLNPYGIPYVPGSGVKGVVRRAAEELALFDTASGWTMPLVWILFGFDATGACVAPPNRGLADELRRRHERWRVAFAAYTENRAAKDGLLKWWLSLDSLRASLPDGLRGLADDPKRFCQALQEASDDGKALRKAIHWQGALRFWDVFPEIDRMEVDILNPHHKAYFEGKAKPVEVEAPKPVFFLAVPAGSRCAITCELCPRHDDVPLPSNLDDLLTAAIDHTLEWVGIGAKTAVGYGAGAQDPEAAEREERKRREFEERLEREREEQAAAAARRAEEERKQEEARRAAEERARREREERERREAELAVMPGDQAWLVRRAGDNDWEHDNSAFLTDAEAFFGHYEEPGAQALQELSRWLEKKWPGITRNPDAVRGKRQKARYKERPRCIARKVLDLLQ
ncbi:type III-B CRISPR module RAMP protein Cmr6 [Thermodesulfobacteriota bacterium B35]